MKNPELINFMIKNNKELLRYGRKFFQNDQAAEDCIQRLYIKFLNKDYGQITNVRSFVQTALYSQFYNFRRMNRRYKNGYDFNGEFNETNEGLQLLSIEALMEPVMPDCDEQIDQKVRMHNLYHNIELLPNTQKQAINNRLNEINIPTNTEKANYRHGMLNLKKLLNPPPVQE